MGANGAGPSSPQWKTMLCKNYQEDGRLLSDSDLLYVNWMMTGVRCEFGGRCQFAHGQLELRTLAQNYLQLNPQVSICVQVQSLSMLYCFMAQIF